MICKAPIIMIKFDNFVTQKTEIIIYMKVKNMGSNC